MQVRHLEYPLVPKSVRMLTPGQVWALPLSDGPFQLHICSIVRSGGSILGCRPLEADGFEPGMFRGAEHHANRVVLRGLTPVRVQLPTDRELPVLCSSGYGVPTLLAERRFVTRTGASDAHPAAAADERRARQRRVR